ncbi:phospholipid/cholesterol/gamma-HCH transport system substrate-binding protein [Candidatus Magnetomoraceae bacterium gMMP-13]
MKLNYTKREKIVGLFMFVVIFLMLSTLIFIGRGKNWFKTYVTYYTLFDESYNLSENSPVKLSKADIGMVKDITLDGDKVRIELSILEDYTSRIRSNSMAIVESPTFIGSEYVSIQSGTKDKPALPYGSEIKSKKKKSVHDILDEFEVEKTAKKLIKAAQNLSDITVIMRDPNGPLFTAVTNINKILAHVEKITDFIQSGKGTIGGLLTSKILLNNLYAQLDKLDSIMKNLDSAVKKTPKAIDQLKIDLVEIQKVINKIQNNTESFKIIMENIEKGSYDFPRITRTTKKGIQEIRDGVKDVNDVVKSLKKNIFIRQNLSDEKEGEFVDTGLRR